MLRPDTRSRASSVPVAWLMSLDTIKKKIFEV